MVVRPGLIGSLCRQPNWCEVEEVEEILMAKEKYAELIVLYNGKKMHSKALDLLHTYARHSFARLSDIALIAGLRPQVS